LPCPSRPENLYSDRIIWIQYQRSSAFISGFKV
jgi:hypothetical protein